MTPATNAKRKRKMGRRPCALAEIADWEPLVIQAAYSCHALAKLCGVSLRHLQRHMRSSYDRTLSALIETVRLQKAREMLAGGIQVKVAALSFGYKQISHFSRNFRNHFGSCPSEFVIRTILGGSRNQLRAATAAGL